MPLTRRQTLRLVGGGTILAAGTAAAVPLTRQPTDALAPWGAAGGYAEPRMRALSYAILAPNPHNRQPWLVDLSVPDTVTLYVDLDRLLPHTDPFNRQITIGLGCFLETLRMAALQDGYAVAFDLFPQGDDPTALDGRPVAICRFAPTDAPSDPLFAQVPFRRSLKEPFDMTRTVDPADLDAVAAVARHSTVAHTTDPAAIPVLRDLSEQAMRIEFDTHRTYKESVDLFRIGAKEINANPDGIDLGGPLFEAMRMTGLFTREAAMIPGGTAKEQGWQAVRANFITAMGYIWQVTPTNTRIDQIRAGQDWMRLNLALTEKGIGQQPLSQALQEFPEMADTYAEVHALLAPTGGTVQMWARVGYGPDVPQSPRWSIEDKLIGG